MELAHRKSFGVSELFDLHNTVELIQQHVYAHRSRENSSWSSVWIWLFMNLYRLGASAKDGTKKVGRFGVGFNAVYHVTDVPSAR